MELSLRIRALDDVHLAQGIDRARLLVHKFRSLERLSSIAKCPSPISKRNDNLVSNGISSSKHSNAIRYASPVEVRNPKQRVKTLALVIEKL